jgi:prepilin peptidase CpaA
LGAAALLVAAAAWDLRSYRVPNKLCAALLLLFVPLAPFLPAGEVGARLAVAALVFAGGVALFHYRLFGGGDVKLLGAAMPWVPPGEAGMALALVALAGGALAVMLELVRRIAPAGASRLMTPGAPIPYACAIAFGVLATYLTP